MDPVDRIAAALDDLGFVFDEAGTGGVVHDHDTVFYQIGYEGFRFNDNKNRPGAFPRYLVILIVRYNKQKLAQVKLLKNAAKAVYPALAQLSGGQLDSESVISQEGNLIGVVLGFNDRTDIVNIRD